MSVFRVHKTDNYTVLSNYHLKDQELSLQAKGLLSVMLSLPDDWNYSINGLAAICKEGTKAIKSTLNELKEHGYLVVKKTVPERGSNRFRYRYDVYEMPVLAKPQVAEGYPSVPLQGVPLQGEPLQAVAVQDGTQLNTNNKGTNELSTNNEVLTSERTILSGKPKADSRSEEIAEVIDYLNAVTGSRYSTRNKQVCGYINARLRDGFSVGDFRQVIDVKSSQWLNTEMAKYLRPSTLFAPSHFVEYLNEVPSNPLGGYDLDAYELEEWAPSK